MSETKYGKYIIYQTKGSPLHPPGNSPWVPILNVSSADLKGAFYFECIWITKTISESDAYKPHYHDFDEFIGMFGSNPADFRDLGGEVEFWFDDEKHIITRSCVIFVPRGIWHTPILIPKLERPMFFLSTAPTQEYSQHVNRSPEWSHLKDPPLGEIIVD